MFENLVVDTLTRLLGDYIIGLDGSRVQVGVWNGDLQLRNLELRPEAISVLFESIGIDMPIVVNASSVDLLHINIPWSQLQSKSVLLKLSNVVVLATPQRENGVEIYTYGKLRLKMSQLLADDAVREGNWTTKSKGLDGSKGTGPTWGSRWKSRILQKVADNVQIEFTNVVIRYEDVISAPEHPFVMHVKFDELSVKSTDESWEALFVKDEIAPVGYTLAHLSGFQMTLGALKERFDTKSSSKSQLHAKLQELSREPELVATDDRRLLLAPLDAILRVSQVKYWKIGAAEQEHWRQQRPMAQIEVLFPMVDVMLDQFQYERLLQFSNEIFALQKKGEYAFRPSSGRGWWLWALERILPGFNERRRVWRRELPSQMRKWRMDLKLYVSARKTLLSCRRSGKSVYPEVLDVLESLEKKLPIEDVLLYRSICDQGIELDHGSEIAQGSGTPSASFTVRRPWSVFGGRQGVTDDHIDTSTTINTDNTPPRGRSGRGSLGLSELALLNQEVLESSASLERTTTRHVLSRDSSKRSDADGVTAVRPEITGAILVQKGSVRISTGGGTAFTSPFLSTTITELRLGFEREFSCDYFQMDILLGSIESWDLEKQMKVVSPRSGERQERASLQQELKRDSWHPSGLLSALETLRRSDATDVKTAGDKCDYVVAMRYAQKSAEQSLKNRIEMSIEAAVAAFDLIVDGSSACLRSCTTFLRPPEAVDYVMDALSDAAAIRLGNFRRRLQAVFLQRQEPMSIDIFFQTSRFALSCGADTDPSAYFQMGTLTAQSLGNPMDMDPADAIRYAKYHISLSNVSVFTLPQMTGEVTGELIKPMHFSIEAAVLQDPDSVMDLISESDREKYPKLRISGFFPTVDVLVAQASYWQLVKIFKVWLSGPLLEERAPPANTFAAVLTRQLDRRKRALALLPSSILPNVSLDITLRGLTVSFFRSDNKFIACELNGFTTSYSTTNLDVRCSVSLRSFQLTSWTEKKGPTEVSENIVAFAGSNEMFQGDDGQSFVKIDYIYSHQSMEQNIKLRCLRLNTLLIREVVIDAVRYFYEESFGSSVYIDPLSLTAARRLKNQAKDVVHISREIVQKRGYLRVTAAFDGVQCTLSGDEWGQVALVDIQTLCGELTLSSSEGLTIFGGLDTLRLQNLMGDAQQHRVVVEYVNSAAPTKDSWKLTLPNRSEEQISLIGSFCSLSVVHTNLFFSQLKGFLNELKDSTVAIAYSDGRFGLSEFLNEEIEQSKKIIPNFRVALDFFDVDIIVPRSLQDHGEAIRVQWSRSWINNHPASEGYNFAFNTGANNVSVSVLYPLDAESLGLRDTAEKEHIVPSMTDVNVFLKVDWWRESLPLREGSSNVEYMDEVDPHLRLPAFRLRWSLPDGIDVRFCEAQYTVLYFVLTESFSEPSETTYQELLHDAEVVARRKSINEEIDGETPWLQILYESSTVRARIAEGVSTRSDGDVFEAEFGSVTGRLDVWFDWRTECFVSGALRYLKDCRMNSGNKRMVVRQTNGTDEHARFTLAARQAYLGKLIVKFSAPKLSLVVVPELIAKITTLTVPGYPFLRTSRSGSDSPFTGTEVTFDLPGFEAWLCAEQTKTDHRAVILRGGLKLMSSMPAFSDELKTELLAQGLQISIVTQGLPSDHDDDEESIEIEETPLLFPMDMNIEYESFQATEKSMLTLTVDAILCRVAVEDANLVVAIVTRMFGRSHQQEKDSIERATPRFQLSLYASFQAARILFTSESSERYIPIMDVNLKDSTVRAQLPSSLSFTAEPCINLFDESKGWWVPGLETWQVAVKLHQTLEEKLVTVDSEKELALNITPVTVKGAFRVARAIRQAVENLRSLEIDETYTNKISRPSTAAFCVRNQTGLNMRLWYSQGGSQIPLPTGEEFEAFVPKAQLMRTGTVDVSSGHLRCALLPEGYRPMTFTIAEQGVHIVKMEKITSDGLVQTCPLVWDVSMRNGVPVGTARSLYRLVNRCETAFEIKVLGEKGERMHSELIAPSETWDVPLVMSDLAFRMRPVHKDSRRYDWSDVLRMPDMLASVMAQAQTESKLRMKRLPVNEVDATRRTETSGGSRTEEGLVSETERNRSVIRCQEKLSGEYVNIALEKVVKHSSEGSAAGFSRQLLDVLVYAPLVVVNELPRPLYYRLSIENSLPMRGTIQSSKATRSCICEGVLNTLECKPIYAAEEDLDKLFMAISFNNSVLTTAVDREVRFGNDVNVGAVARGTASFTIMGMNGREEPAPIRLELVESDEGRRLCVFASYWIYNRSDVDLEFQSWSHKQAAPLTPSGSVFLRARPPGEKADNYMGFMGSHISLRRTGDKLSVSQIVNLTNIQNGFMELSIRNSSLVLVLSHGGSSQHRTTLIRILNSMWIENMTSRTFQWCVSSAMDGRGIVPSTHVKTILPGGLSPIHSSSSFQHTAVCFRLANADGSSEWFWTHPVQVALDDILSVKMYNPISTEQYISLVRTKTLATQVKKLIMHEEDMERPPYWIRNHCTAKRIVFRQIGSKARPWLLLAGQQARYSWDFPFSKDRSLLVRVVGDEDDSTEDSQQEVVVFLDEVRQSLPLGEEVQNTGVLVTVSVQGSSKIITFKEAADGKKFDRNVVASQEAIPTLGWDDFLRGNYESEAAAAREDGEGDEPEALLQTNRVVVKLPRIGISVVDLTPTEIIYARALDLFFLVKRVEDSDAGSFNFSVMDVQIDNELPNASNPVLLWSPVEDSSLSRRNSSTGTQPKLPSLSVSGESPVRTSLSDSRIDGNVDDDDATNQPNDNLSQEQPFIELIVNYQLDKEQKRIAVVEGLYFALKQIQLRVDEELVARLRQFTFTLFDINEDELVSEAFDRAEDQVNEIFGHDEEENVSALHRVYLKKLYIWPIHMTISLATSPASLLTLSSSHSGTELMATARNVMAVVGNIENADFELKALELEHAFVTIEGIRGLLVKYYYDQLSSQRFKLITSSNLFTQPAAAFESITSGVRDFFTETIAIKSSKEFHADVPDRAASLMEKNGATCAASSISCSGSTDAREGDRILGEEECGKQATMVDGDPCRGQSSGGEARSESSRSPGGVHEGEMAEDAREREVEDRLIGSSENELDRIVKKTSGRKNKRSHSRSENGFLLDGKWMRPPRTFSKRRLVAYDLHRAMGQLLLRSLGLEDSVLGWVSLTEEQPDEPRQWEMWMVMREYLKGGRAKEHLEAMDSKSNGAGHYLNRINPALAVVSAARVIVARIDGTIVWACSLDNVVDIKRSETEEQVLRVGVKPYSNAAEIFWPSIICGSSRSRDMLLDLLNVMKAMRNRWQDEVLLGPLTREGTAVRSLKSTDVDRDALHDLMELAQEAPLRDPDSHRSIRVVIANHLDKPLILHSSRIKSGNWCREAPKRIAPSVADFCELDGGKGLTVDIHGNLLYTVEGTPGNDLLRFSFVNLFLAPNAYHARGPAAYTIRIEDSLGSDNHALVSYIVDKPELSVSTDCED